MSVCLARAVVEGVALSLAHALEALREAGAPPARLLLTGGGSRSGLLSATLTGLTGLPGFVARGGGATLGAAQLAAVAVGIHPDLAAARVAMAPPLEPIAPQALPEGLLDRYRKAAVGRGD
jgi:xylulokinase